MQHKEEASRYAEKYVDSIVERSRLIGVNGNELIGNSKKILTHCNAGALASVDYGTALSPIRKATESGQNPFVWVDETSERDLTLSTYTVINDILHGHRKDIRGIRAEIMNVGIDPNDFILYLLNSIASHLSAIDLPVVDDLRA